MEPLAMRTLLLIGCVAVIAVVLFSVRRSRALRRRQRAVLSPVATVARTRFPLARPSLAMVMSAPRWRAMSLSFLLGAAAGNLLGGPVAAFALGLYATVAALFMRRRHAAKAHRAARSALLDRLTGLAADLRAGIPMPSATETAFLDPASTGAGPGLVALTRAAATLAERTGAPLAELIDRIEADARAGDRARAAAAAQAAGAQATGLMLAGLPVAGLGLGFVIGTDPLAILLHTPLGAACALAAVALQTIGLIWSQHLQPRQP
ncbi:MAG TPA: hypothetical protein VGP16_11885 [Asanoa sp.]|nr:hypothetical protein [Asanoa sp.]